MADSNQNSGIQFDSSDPAIIANPYPAYDQLRINDPIHWIESENHWIVTRYEDVSSLLVDDRISSNRFAAMASTLSEQERQALSVFINTISSWMPLVDPPDHTRLRGIVNKAFTPRVVENIRERIQILVDEMLDAVQDKGKMDIISDLAVPLPGTVISEMLGVPTEDHERFKQWTEDVANGLFGVVGTRAERIGRAQQSIVELNEYFAGIIADLRENPKDNLMNALVQAEEEGERLTEEELYANCILLLSAGHETTTNLIGNGMLALLRNPDQLEKLKNDPSLIVTAIEEMLRYDSPAQKLTRLVSEDIELHGKVVKKGQLMYMGYGSANHDPEQFDEPAKFDVARSANRHLAFARGAHYCLGAALARLEGQITINSVLRRMPNISLEVDADKLDWNPSANLRGLKALPVAF